MSNARTCCANVNFGIRPFKVSRAVLVSSRPAPMELWKTIKLEIIRKFFITIGRRIQWLKESPLVESEELQCVDLSLQSALWHNWATRTPSCETRWQHEGQPSHIRDRLSLMPMVTCVHLETERLKARCSYRAPMKVLPPKPRPGELPEYKAWSTASWLIRQTFGWTSIWRRRNNRTLRSWSEFTMPKIAHWNLYP